MTSLFLMQILAFIIVVRKINVSFGILRESWARLGKNGLVTENEVENLTKFDLIWPDIDLSSSQTSKRNATIKFCVKMTHKSCVARHSYICIWWPDLTRPWALLSIRSILIHCLFLPLGTLLVKCGFAAVIIPLSVANKAKSDYFDVWLNLAWDLLRFFSFP